MNDLTELERRMSVVEHDLERVHLAIARASARGSVENVFSRYMYLHNAFRDADIVDLWVDRGTPGIMARYTNSGKYTTYDSVIEYHLGRPTPEGKLIYHYTTTPVIEVAGDGKTAKGVWMVAGLESGLTDPDVAATLPPYFFSPTEVRGKKVWAHWVWVKYSVDFLLQGEDWKIWKFRCFEVARAPFEENWISFADKNNEAFKLDIKYFGDNGDVVFMPEPDEPVSREYWPYKVDGYAELAPTPPTSYETYAEEPD